jgi:hypothetical protein
MTAVAVVVGLFVRRAHSPPAAFSHRRALPSCGRISTDGAQGLLSASDRVTIDCFATAFESARQVEVSYVRSTVEGDRIEYWVRVIGLHSIEQFVHNRDSHGARGWTADRCSGLADAGKIPFGTGCHPI